MKAAVLWAAVFSLGLLLLAVAPGHTQTPAPPPQAAPPLPGFVPPYEITRIVRSAGFSPLAPPLREGTTYVVRATDFRGILMRVVIDARSGAIRAVNRIVAGSAPYGPIGMLPPPEGVPPSYSELPYDLPPDYGVPPAYGPPAARSPVMAPLEESAAPPPLPAPPPPAIRSVSLPFVSAPPLPRPRPAELVSHKGADDAKQGGNPAAAPAVTAPGAAPSAPKGPPAAVVPLPD